jgi:FBP C-terminal treble-clef zinc-finger
MLPLDENEIRRSFVNCSRGTAKAVTLPSQFRELSWGDLDFLGWYDPKIPARSYLVVPHSDRVVGLLLRAADSTVRRPGAGLCNLCHSAREANDVLLFAAPRAGASGRQGNTVGTYICADLDCSLYARGLLKLTGPQPEPLPPEVRAQRLRERLGLFVDRVLEQ